MEKASLFRPLNRCCCCRYRGSRESEPLFLAVYKNNLQELRLLLAAGMSPNAKSERGNTLLNYAIEHKRREIFDFLLSLDDIDVNCLDSSGRSPLLYTIAEAFDEYFAMMLIAKGADNCLKDDAGFNLLHLAARKNSEDNLKIGQLFLERGVDVNALNNFGESPLYIACSVGNAAWIHLLLFYGAVATNTCNGVLPLAVLSSNTDTETEEILFNHTFEGTDNSIQLRSLVASMALDSSLFPKILNVTSDVLYDIDDLQHLDSNLIYLKGRHFRLFVEKFGYIVREMIRNFPPLPMLVRIGLDLEIPELKEIFYAFLDSNVIAEFVQTADPTYPTISNLIRICINQPEMSVDEEEITRIVCEMLSYGLNVTSDDLDTVYCCYGNCGLFKILLHMDIDLVYVGKSECVMAVFYYDVNADIRDLFKYFSSSNEILSYFNYSKLNEMYINEAGNEEMRIKAKSLPPITCLVELARNAVRKYIVDRYKIKNSRQFYTVLQWLPVGEIYKKIIGLDKKLYWF